MLTVTPRTAFVIYLAMTLFCILGIWFYYHFISASPQKKIVEDVILYQCEYCQNIYLDDQIKEVTECPDCKSLNKNNTDRRKNLDLKQ